MEDSGFKVYKNFKTSQKVIDIYAILPTTIGDFGVVVACKNYEKEFRIGVDVLKEMEDVQASIKASKVTIVTSAYFSEQARNYALRKNIKLVDRDNLLEMAKKYQDRTNQTTLDNTPYDGGASAYIEEEYPEYNYDASDMEYIMQRRQSNPYVYQNTLYRQTDEPESSGFSSLLHRHAPQRARGSLSPYSQQTNLYNYDQRASHFTADSLLFTLNTRENVSTESIAFLRYVITLSAFLSLIACSKMLLTTAGASSLLSSVTPSLII